MTLTRKICLLLTLAYLGGCASVQYKALEKVGIHKRDILIDRVESARESQTETKDQVVSAYQQFRNLVTVNDGGLEKRYKALTKAVNRSKDKTEELDDRINSVESVAAALFSEWTVELNQYSSPALRSQSAKNLSTTKNRYQQMIRRMRTAQSRIKPVLYVLEDQTLYLKHNLNARAISGLQGEVDAIEGKVNTLIQEMEAAVQEANHFLKGMKTGG